MWENTNVQLSCLFLFWLLYPNISKTDILSCAKGNFSLQIKLQPAIHFTFTKWPPLDYNLLLLPSHTGTGGSSIKDQTVQWQLCAAHADPSLPLLSDTHTHTGSSERVRGRTRLPRFIYCNTQELDVLNTSANQDTYLDKIQSTNFRHSWSKTFISTVPGFFREAILSEKAFLSQETLDFLSVRLPILFSYWLQWLQQSAILSQMKLLHSNWGWEHLSGVSPLAELN